MKVIESKKIIKISKYKGIVKSKMNLFKLTPWREHDITGGKYIKYINTGLNTGTGKVCSYGNFKDGKVKIMQNGKEIKNIPFDK